MNEIETGRAINSGASGCEKSGPAKKTHGPLQLLGEGVESREATFEVVHTPIMLEAYFPDNGSYTGAKFVVGLRYGQLGCDEEQRMLPSPCCGTGTKGFELTPEKNVIPLFYSGHFYVEYEGPTTLPTPTLVARPQLIPNAHPGILNILACCQA